MRIYFVPEHVGACGLDIFHIRVAVVRHIVEIEHIATNLTR